MVERICPGCAHGNPLDDRYCGKCGAPLERQLPVRQGPAPLALLGRQLPVSWKQVGKTVAISAAALAAEAGIAWLRQRVIAGAAEPALRVGRPARETTELARGGGRVVTIISQRIVEMWDSGDGQRKIVEQSLWRRIDE